MTTVQLKATVSFVLVLYLQSCVSNYSMPQCMPFRNYECTLLQLRYFELDYKAKTYFINCVVDFLKLSSLPCSLDSTETAVGHFAPLYYLWFK